MKKWILPLLASGLLLSACGGDGKDDKGSEDESNDESASVSSEEGDETEAASSFTCSMENRLESVAYNDTSQTFDNKYTYANYNKTFSSYRVIFINYDREQDSDYREMESGEIKVVVGLFNPTDGEFKPGKYMWNAGEGAGQIAVTLKTDDGDKMCNYAGMDQDSWVEISSVSETQICGEAHIVGKGGFEINATFNAEHEDL